jgi:hypothetical protein
VASDSECREVPLDELHRMLSEHGAILPGERRAI